MLFSKPGESEIFRGVSPRLSPVSFPVTARPRSRSGGGDNGDVVCRASNPIAVRENPRTENVIATTHQFSVIY